MYAIRSYYAFPLRAALGERLQALDAVETEQVGAADQHRPLGALEAAPDAVEEGRLRGVEAGGLPSGEGRITSYNVCYTKLLRLLGFDGIERLQALAQRCTQGERRCLTYSVFNGPNSIGAALFADGDDFNTLLAAMEAGTIRGLICLESDPLSDTTDPGRTAVALAHLELLVCIDSLPTLTTRLV